MRHPFRHCPDSMADGGEGIPLFTLFVYTIFVNATRASVTPSISARTCDIGARPSRRVGTRTASKLYLAACAWTRNGTYGGRLWLSIEYDFILCSCQQILTDTGTRENHNHIIINAMRFGFRYVSAPNQALEWALWPAHFRRHGIDLRTGTLPGTNLASTASASGIERPARFFRHRPANRTQTCDPHASDALSISVRP